MSRRDGALATTSGEVRSRRSAWATLSLIGVVAAASLSSAFACTGPVETNGFDTTSSGATSGDQGGTGGNQGGEGGSIFGTGGGIATSPLKVFPDKPVFKVEIPLTAQTVQFTCVDTNTNLPITGATWSMDNVSLGKLDANGLFTPTGLTVGESEVTCGTGSATASTTLKVLIHALDDQGGLTMQQKATLRGPPGGSDAQWQMLYPYDQTVFPRGILAPEVHLTGGSFPGSAYYMHVVIDGYEYEGFFSVSATDTQLQMSQQAWDALTNSAKGQKVDVLISKLSGGQKYGPIFRRWRLANGKLHGTIYYNTYDSPLAGTGAMMRIKGTSATPEVLIGDCTVCHSISSDGSTAAAANHNGPGGTFDLTSGNLNPPIVWQDAERAAFAALYPKGGQVLVVNGAPGGGYPPNTPGTNIMTKSELRTKNGTVIPGSGIENLFAMTPVFSHDGKMLAFNDRSGVQSGSFWPGSLAALDYDEASQKFTNYQVLGTPPVGRQYSWPAFTPDSKYVIYQDGVGEDLATWQSNTGKLLAVNTQSKVVAYVENLNGDGYMPQGSRDENKNYEPTIAPIASGGYFWIMFTSRRTYGNKLTGDPGSTKRLWVAAMDVNAQDGIDATHPAFYISGQELTSGNSRGFWALDPCKSDGQTCESGDECCNGFCNPKGTPPQNLCAPPDGSCSDEFENCTTTADCCDPAFQCIGGKCTSLPPD